MWYLIWILGVGLATALTVMKAVCAEGHCNPHEK